ncbi:MAG TPA: hypothetical protein VF255_03140 [Solirubrobacterales bacterium]
MTEQKKTYGRTIKGELITDDLIDRIVREAEEGYDVDELRRQMESAEDHGQTNPARTTERSARRSQ